MYLSRFIYFILGKYKVKSKTLLKQDFSFYALCSCAMPFIMFLTVSSWHFDNSGIRDGKVSGIVY